MGYLNYSKKLIRLQSLVKNRSANTVDSLSSRMDISRRTVLRMVDNLRAQGVNLEYCKKKKVYFIE